MNKEYPIIWCEQLRPIGLTKSTVNTSHRPSLNRNRTSKIHKHEKINLCGGRKPICWNRIPIRHNCAVRPAIRDGETKTHLSG